MREAWAVGNIYDGVPPSKICDWNPPGVKHAKAPCGVAYPASGGCVGLKSRLSIHMPRWASRILLEVTAVRVERLQDVSEADAIAEGIAQTHTDIMGRAQWKVYAHQISDGDPAGERAEYCGKPYTACPRESFRSLWLSINGPGSRDANPWVWVVEFKRIEAQDAAA